MKRTAFALFLVAFAAAANADTFFDAIYADAGQTTLRTNVFDPTDSFDTSFFLKQHLISSDFVSAASGAASYVEFAYENRSASAISTTLTGTIEIFDKVNPRNGETNYYGLAYPDPSDSTGKTQAAPLLTSTFSVSVSAAANGTGVVGFTLDTPVSLTAGSAYGFAIKTNSDDLVPAATSGTTVGTGSIFRNILHYDIPNTGVMQAGGIYIANSMTSVGFALHSAAPVPEPTTIAALGLGAAAMIRRRKRS